MRPVFLSASEPYQGRDREYLDSRNIGNLREAIRALCAHVLPRGKLVFGGHPAISPLVRGLADRLECRGNVLMFQSRAFVEAPLREAYFGDEHRADTILTDAHDREGAEAARGKAWRNMSLLRMRYEMLGGPSVGPVYPLLERFQSVFGRERENRCGTFEFEAAFFIGGMEGVEREFRIFRSFHPHTPAYPIASTGSAAMGLLRELEPAAGLARSLTGDTAYSLLMEQCLPTREVGRGIADFRGPGVRARSYPADQHLDPAELDRPIIPGAGRG